MKSTNVFDEEQVRNLLGGGDREVAEALAQIICHLQAGLCGWLRRNSPGLTPEDLADTWQETLLSVITAVRNGRFDARRPLLPWLCAIACRRATDVSRRRSSAKDALAAMGRALAGTSTGQQWKDLAARERDEALELTREHIETLPAMQRIVLRTFSDHYPESRNMETLRVLVSKARGEEATLASVKRALQKGRRKLKEFLERNGHGPRK